MKYNLRSAPLLVIGFLLFVHGQDLFAQANRKPETSKSNEFVPADLSKVAILVAGQDKPNNRLPKAKAAQADTLTDQQRLVEDVFLESLLAKGHTVVARSDIEGVFKEKGFQASGLTEEVAASVGKLLNIPAVLVVRITEVSAEQAPGSKFLIGRTAIGARLISVETGAILWNGTHNNSANVNSSGATSGLLLATAASLAEAFPEKVSAFDPTTAKPVTPKAFPKLAVIMVAGDVHTRTLGRFGVKADDVPSDQQRRVEDAFINVLTAKGYRLVSRSDMAAVAKEQQFQKSGFTEDNAVAAGKILNVPAVMMVRVTNFAVEPFQGPVMKGKFGAQATTVHFARVSLGARLVDVNRGEIWWAHGGFATQQVRTKGDGNDVLDSLAKDVAEFFPPADSKNVQLAQAEKLLSLGQITASISSFRSVISNNPGTPEAKKAEARLKVLGGKK